MDEREKEFFRRVGTATPNNFKLPDDFVVAWEVDCPKCNCSIESATPDADCFESDPDCPLSTLKWKPIYARDRR